MDYNKIEDSVFKKAMEVFKEGASEFFNLGVKIDKPAHTEIKNIDIKTNVMDYLFYMEDGDYLHFEFQTTKKQEDISRFLYYDSSLHYSTKKNIRTIVIYSSDINEAVTELNCGTIDYKVEAFYMSSLDGDKKLDELKNKILKEEILTEEDIMGLCFIPLMKSKKSKSDIIIESIETASKIKISTYKNKCLMLLYALFDKFGDEISKKKFKEVLTLTEVGKMIYDEGLEEGIEKGMEKGIGKGKSELLIKQLIKKFKVLPEGLREKIMNLPSDTLEIIATEIFDMESIEDLKKYI